MIAKVHLIFFEPKRFSLLIATAIACAILSFSTTPSYAQPPQELDSLTSIAQSVKDNILTITIQTKNSPPQASAYYLSAPERLIIELNDALKADDLKLAGPPQSAMIEGWSLKEIGLNRSQLQLLLRHRPANGELKNTISGNTLNLSLSLDPSWREELKLTEGVSWIREDKYLAGNWVRLNRLLFNPKDPNISVILGLANDNPTSRETISSMLKRTGALAGVNGGFFASAGGPLGLVYKDDKLMAPEVGRRPPRSGLAITKDGTALFGRPIANGKTVKDLDGGDWSNLSMALGAGPRLIKDGQTKITSKEEELGPGGNDITRLAARSLAALLNNGKLMLATITGYRDNHSQGAKFEATTEWLKSTGAQQAVNFDGGASVDMVIDSLIVSDGPASTTAEKPVGTAVLVKDDRPRLYPKSYSWADGQTTLTADGESSFEIALSFQNASGSKVADGTPVRFFAYGVQIAPGQGIITNGKATAKVISVRRTGSAKIIAECGPLTATKLISLRGGEANRIQAKILSQKALKGTGDKKTLRTNIRVALTDLFGNPVANDEFSLSLDGGEGLTFKTDSRGLSNLEVDTALEGGTASIAHPKAGTISLKIEPPKP